MVKTARQPALGEALPSVLVTSLLNGLLGATPLSAAVLAADIAKQVVVGAAGSSLERAVHSVFQFGWSRKAAQADRPIGELLGAALLAVLDRLRDEAKGPEKRFFQQLLQAMARSEEAVERARGEAPAASTPLDEEEKKLQDYFVADPEKAPGLSQEAWSVVLKAFDSRLDVYENRAYFNDAADRLRREFPAVLRQMLFADQAPEVTGSQLRGRAYAAVSLRLLGEVSRQVEAISTELASRGPAEPSPDAARLEQAVAELHTALEARLADVQGWIERELPAHLTAASSPLKGRLDEAAESLAGLGRSVRSLHDRLEALEHRAAKRHAELMEKLERQATAATAAASAGERTIPSHRVGFRALLQDLPEDPSPAQSLVYSYGRDKFEGRDELKKTLLEEFLAFDAPPAPGDLFRWTLIYGGAGSGKSRFALELLKEARDRFRAALSEEAGWEEAGREEGEMPPWWGILDRNSFDRFRPKFLRRWALESPALLVIDYAGMTRQLGESLATLHGRAQDCGKRVRVILLDRRVDLEQINGLLGGGGHKDALRSSMFPTGGRPNELGIKLPQLHPAVLVRIMQARIGAKRSLESREEGDGAWLLEQLDSIDPKERRPLFAAMVGQVLARTESQQQSEGPDWLQNRIDLLDQIHDMEEEHWTFPGDTFDAQVVDRHKNLVALSTVCRTLTTRVLGRIEAEAGLDYPPLNIPSGPHIQPELVNRVTLERPPTPTGERPIGLLEPDLLGEWFVLRRIAGSEPTAIEARALANVSWRYLPDDTAKFILKCFQDHPRTPFSMLFPDPGIRPIPVLRLLRDLLRECLALLDEQKGDLIEPPEEAEEITALAETLFGLVRQHAESMEGGTGDATFVETVSDATLSFVNIRLWTRSIGVRRITRSNHELLEVEAPIDHSVLKRAFESSAKSVKEEEAESLVRELAGGSAHTGLLPGEAANLLAEQFGLTRRYYLADYSASVARDTELTYGLAASLLEESTPLLLEDGDTLTAEGRPWTSEEILDLAGSLRSSLWAKLDGKPRHILGAALLRSFAARLRADQGLAAGRASGRAPGGDTETSAPPERFEELAVLLQHDPLGLWR